MSRSLPLALVLVALVGEPSAQAADACNPIPFELAGKSSAEAKRRFPKLKTMGTGLYINGIDFYCLPTDLLLELSPDDRVKTIVVGFLPAQDPKEEAVRKVLVQKLESDAFVSKGRTKLQKCDVENFKGPAGKVKLMWNGEYCPLQIAVER